MIACNRLYLGVISAIVRSDRDSMRRKAQQPKPEQVVPAEMLEQAKRSIAVDQIKKSAKCSVCGADTVSTPGECLCWVCRRLKISAWREIEQAIPLQE